MAKPKREEGQAATLKERVITHLRRRDGEHVTTGEVANALGITRAQATSALHNLAKNVMPDTVRRVSEGVWMYTAPKPYLGAGLESLSEVGEGTTVYRVGRLTDGTVLVTDEDGQLYEMKQVAG